MKKLSTAGFSRARDFIRSQARPLERALFAHEFEGAPAEPALAALAEFRNSDGGFGRALEPDLRAPGSSALAALTALDLLRDLGCDARDSLVRSAIGWLVDRFDPEIPGWRCIPPDTADFAHAPHWQPELHAPGGPWPVAIIPGAGLLSHLEHWRELAPDTLRKALLEALLSVVSTLDEAGADSLVYLARVEHPALRARARALAQTQVTRDPALWTTYCAKPLKLAPAPDAPLYDGLAEEVTRNLDWELEQQGADGPWSPNWDWQGHFPAEWQVARREWQGELTLRTLRSFRAFGRLQRA
ncbi:MAG TPA: hypothetical protein VMR50_09835 [Myxococcota bacterium]|nr:hypothetical protein [Myxococcota bacterium]